MPTGTLQRETAYSHRPAGQATSLPRPTGIFAAVPALRSRLRSGPAEATDDPQRPATVLLEHCRHGATADSRERWFRVGRDGLRNGDARPHGGAYPLPPDQSWRAPRHRRPDRHLRGASHPSCRGHGTCHPPLSQVRVATKPRSASSSCSRRQCGPMASPLALSFCAMPPTPTREMAASLRHVPAIAGQAALEEPQPASVVTQVVGKFFLEHGGLAARAGVPEEHSDGPDKACRRRRRPGTAVGTIVFAADGGRVALPPTLPNAAAARHRTRSVGSSADGPENTTPRVLKLNRFLERQKN